MVDDSQIISDLIGCIYDAALDRALWSLALEKTCAFVQGQSAMLFARRQTRYDFEWGNKPRFLESYVTRYHDLNPFDVPLMVRGEVGEVRLASEYVSPDEYLKSRFYREWMAPQHIIDAILTLFEKTAVGYSGLAILRHERADLVKDEAKRRIRLLYPHFRRAVTIGHIIDLQKFEAATFADSLDGLAFATYLVDASGSVVHANAAGIAMLDKSDPIRAVAGKLSVAERRADRALHDLFIAAEHDDQVASAKSIDVPLCDGDGEQYVAHVLPLTSGARRRAGTTYCAVAAVFVRKAALELPHPLQAIATVFKLTTAEMRVLMTVIQMGGAREAMPALGISEATVRAHLRHIFEKTNTSRQIDLVKLVAGYQSPLA
jgi:DNA-binding CsgD family transcriptional regulator